MSYIYILLALLSVIFFWFRTRDIMQPNMLFLFVWYLTAAISCDTAGSFLREWSAEMHFVVIFSGISFWLGTVLYIERTGTARNNDFLREKRNISKVYRRLLFSLYSVCMAAAALEWINGGARISFMELGQAEGDVKSGLEGSIPGVHYATLFLPYVSIMAFFSLMNTRQYKFYDLFVILSSIIASLVFHLSRGDLLIFILSFLFIYSRYHRVKKKQILLVSSVIIIMFVTIMTLRVSEDTLAFNMSSNPYFSIFYSYIAPCFANLNDLIERNFNYHFYGNASFAPLWTIIGAKDELPVKTIDQLEVFNARTYLYGFYHDYKLIGILIFPFFLGYLVNNLYVLTKAQTSYWILLLAAMQKALLTPFFGNYFFGEMVILFPYLFLTLIILFLKRQDKLAKNYG